jgi:foldase protein PrsA
VAAVVNGTTITTKQVADEALRMYGPQVVKNLIVETLVEQEAKKNNDVPTDAQVDAELQNRRNQIASSGSGRTLEQLLTQNNISLDDFKKSIKLTLEAGNLVAKEETPATLVHVKHLLVQTTNMQGGPNAKPPHTDAEALAIIAKAQADLKAGKAWDDVVKTYSEDPSNKNTGGDLGILSPKSPMDPAFLKAALALKAGETSEPVKSSFGYHLIMAVSTSVNPPATEQAAYAQALKSYTDQQLHQLIPQYVQSLQEKASVINYLAPNP